MARGRRSLERLASAQDLHTIRAALGTMAYWRLHYHLIWSTFQRLPLLDAHRTPPVYRAIQSRATRLGVFIHQIGGIEDHVHVVTSIPPRLAVAECIGQFKGASSHTANAISTDGTAFRWESGYGALSVSERALPMVIRYVANQREHHARGSVIADLERTHATPGDESPG